MPVAVKVADEKRDKDIKALEERNGVNHYNEFEASISYAAGELPKYLFDNHDGVIVMLQCSLREGFPDTLTVYAQGENVEIKDNFTERISEDDFMLFVTDTDGDGRGKLVVSTNNEWSILTTDEVCYGYVINLNTMNINPMISGDKAQIGYDDREDRAYVYYEKYDEKSPIEYGNNGYFAENKDKKQQILDAENERVRNGWVGFEGRAYYDEDGYMEYAFVNEEYGVEVYTGERYNGKCIVHYNGNEESVHIKGFYVAYYEEVGLTDIENDGVPDLVHYIPGNTHKEITETCFVWRLDTMEEYELENCRALVEQMGW